MKTLGQKIYRLRKKHGLSQEDLSYELDVARQTVSKWESDRMCPSTDKIIALCDIFNVPPDYFFGTNEIAATTATEDDERIDTETTAATAENTTTEPVTVTESTDTESVAPNTVIFSKKKIFVLTILISLSVVILIASLIFGGIALYIILSPTIGNHEIHMLNIDIFAVICGFCALLLLTSILSLIFIMRKVKNFKKECFGDKLQTKDDRQNSTNDL